MRRWGCKQPLYHVKLYQLNLPACLRRLQEIIESLRKVRGELSLSDRVHIQQALPVQSLQRSLAGTDSSADCDNRVE
jgi:hypothetical protein